ncbi:MAG: hypothetical protein BAJATHORv1_20173 [Candidatus Thorarchaeota archaeon]|nr:MAG: hypothetical protein BAJATHORv1_20173 [Candidatus Thorarchaeota archaeon]
MKLERLVGPHNIILDFDYIGNDIRVLIYGGDQHHIGGVAIAYPTKSHYRDAITISVSTLTLPGHKDYIVANSAAEKIAKALEQTCVVLVGIHVDNASSQEITAIIEAVDDMVNEVILYNQKGE